MASSSVLFLTNSELGQATVCLAVAHELLVRSTYDVHIASFSPLKASISELNSRAAPLMDSPNRAATFHIVNGKSMIEAVMGNRINKDMFAVHQVGFFGALKAYAAIENFIAPWTEIEYMEIYHSCVRIIQQTKPTMIIVDPLFSQAVDACRKLKWPYVVLGPNTLKDHVLQPMLGNLWKYPILCSGYPYPLPLWLVIPNAVLAIRLGAAAGAAEAIKKIDQRRHANGLVGPCPNLISAADPTTPVLIPSRPETDFPSHIPKNFTLCGPILRPCGPITRESPGLHSWLSQGPTILVNMGSNVRFNGAQVQQLAHGLSMVLEKRPGLQVLWKLQRERPNDEGIHRALSCLSLPIDSGCVRITAWLPVEPICIIQSGYVECVVHHGGSNSYHEAIKAGVPQIVLPVWFDTYDFAARVEWLGVGLWASHTSAPAINGEELGKALIRVLASDETGRFVEKATLISSKLRDEGRVVACKRIVELVDVQASPGP